VYAYIKSLIGIIFGPSKK